jgi:hypothetical protein
MDSTTSGSDRERCEIRFSRLYCSLMFVAGSILLFACLMNPPVSPPTSYVAAFKDDVSFQDGMRLSAFAHWSLVSVVALSTVLSLLNLLRRRPVLVIDDRGVTDHGLLFSGFGLVEWENIESLRRITRLPGHRLPVAWLTVNNRQELIARRSPLLRPLLRVFFFGITVPIVAIDVSYETVSRNIERYSKNKVRIWGD